MSRDHVRKRLITWQKMGVFCLVLLTLTVGGTAAGHVAAANSPATTDSTATGVAARVQDETLTVVTKPIEPFVFTDGPEPRGFSIDLWRAIALEAGLPFEYMVVDTVSETLEICRP